MPKSQESTSVAFRLPRELHNRLKAAAGTRSVSEVIRERLETVVAGDPETQRLTNAIANVAQNIRAPWHEDPFSFAAFAAAINALLASYRPDGAPVPQPDSMAAVLFGPGASPEAAGRTLAAMAASEVRR
jgi:predicted DNA-binding protein